MATAPTAPPTSKTQPRDNFEVEKATFKGITQLTLHGALNDAFEGRKLAEAIKSKKLILNLRDVRRFASWGMSEWMDFLRISGDKDVYLVECSAYALSQINLITGLLGHGKLVSYYASFRCGTCSEELETLFLIPRDRTIIRELPGSSQQCPTCGGQAWLEEYPAAFFDTIAARPSFDIDDEVLAFFRTQYSYELSPDLTRFRAYRRVEKAFTYLRMSGNIATLPSELMTRASEGTTVLDLEKVVFDATTLDKWRAFIKTALPKLPSLHLVNCPVGFFETAVLPEDLKSKVKIRTFALPYDCARCYTTTPYMVDVAENLEELAQGLAPGVQCSTCRASLVATVTPEQIVRLRSLPARDRNPLLDKFLAAARAEPADNLENCSVSLPDVLPTAPERPVRLLYGALTAVLVLGLIVVGFGVWNQYYRAHDVSTTPSPFVVVAPPTAPTHPTFARPDWIMSDVPSSGYCNDMINRLMCVGVSSYRLNREDAIAEATDVALDELVSTVGLKITDPFFRDNVVPNYSKARAKALSALQAADLNRTSDAPGVVAAEEALRKARKRVVEALRLSGGAAVPTQRSDWHWEEYASEKGSGANETLVFIRYDVTLEHSARTRRALFDHDLRHERHQGDDRVPGAGVAVHGLHRRRRPDPGRSFVLERQHHAATDRDRRRRPARQRRQRLRAPARRSDESLRRSEADGQDQRRARAGRRRQAALIGEAALRCSRPNTRRPHSASVLRRFSRTARIGHEGQGKVTKRLCMLGERSRRAGAETVPATEHVVDLHR